MWSSIQVTTSSSMSPRATKPHSHLICLDISVIAAIVGPALSHIWEQTLKKGWKVRCRAGRDQQAPGTVAPVAEGAPRRALAVLPVRTTSARGSPSGRPARFCEGASVCWAPPRLRRRSARDRRVEFGCGIVADGGAVVLAERARVARPTCPLRRHRRWRRGSGVERSASCDPCRSVYSWVVGREARRGRASVLPLLRAFVGWSVSLPGDLRVGGR